MTSAPFAAAVAMRGISKSFGGIRALDNVDLTDNFTSSNGVAIYNAGGLTLTQCTITNSDSTGGSGGAVHNVGSLAVYHHDRCVATRAAPVAAPVLRARRVPRTDSCAS